MQKILIFLATACIFFLSVSCSKDYTEIPASEFTAEVLPEIEVGQIEVINNELVRIYPLEGKPYGIELKQPGSAEAFVQRIRAGNNNVPVTYIHEQTDLSWILILYQLLPVLFLLLLLLHLILLWFSFKKIVRGKIDPLEKLVHLVIVIFTPVIGPLVFLTTSKPS